jgi:hypothetical protein
VVTNVTELVRNTGLKTIFRLFASIYSVQVMICAMMTKGKRTLKHFLKDSRFVLPYI